MFQRKYSSNSANSETDEEDQKPSLDSLPNDIITNILFRLPPLFLYNSAMFVCKTWFQISQSHNSSGLLIQDSRSPNKPARFVHIKNELWETKSTDLNLNFPGKISGTTSDGVLLINNNNNNNGLYVANPVTKQVLKLPILPSTCMLCGQCNNIARISSTGEIKVVSLARNPNGKYNWYVITVQKKNNKAMSWRKISSNNNDDDHDPVSYLSFVQSISAGGVVFWTNSSWITNQSILAIDMHAETVYNLKIDPSQGGHHEYWTLVQMREKMCLMNCGENVGKMKIWELKDLDKNEWIWVNSVRICEESPLRSKFCVPLVWVDSQVIVMSVFVRDSNVVVAYNVRKREYKVIKIGDVARHTIFYHINSLRPF